MEMAKSQNLSPISAFTEGFIRLPAFRQLGVLLGFAAVAALGVALVLWSWTPSYGVLFGSLGDKEVAEIATVLDQRGINYRLDSRTGALMVPTSRVHEVRLQLAAEGLPRSTGQGLEILQQKQEFGTSQFMESARYQHALEMELARSITSIGSVQTARVHLALPKQSVFVRQRQEPTASVLVRLHRGRILEEGQVAAISHLVASSIPNLEPERVTVVDESGRLLSARQRDTHLALNQGQFEYVRNLENSYIGRIEDILMPLVGREGVRAQVAAEVDFSVTEQTSETFNPDLPALRSQEISEEQSLANALQGVPGALVNQPPGQGLAPEVAVGPDGEPLAQQPTSSRRHSTSNFELDRTISHTRMGGGQLRRLSIAVVVRDRSELNEEGERVSVPRPPEEMERLTALVRDAVGYNPLRGDSVNVISAPFAGVEVLEDLPPEPFWERGWVLDLGKVLGALILGMLLIFVVLRPMMRNLSTPKAGDEESVAAGADALPALGSDSLGEDRLSLGHDKPEGLVKLPTPGAYEENIEMVRDVVKQDPKLVAQVMRNWISEDK